MLQKHELQCLTDLSVTMSERSHHDRAEGYDKHNPQLECTARLHGWVVCCHNAWTYGRKAQPGMTTLALNNKSKSKACAQICVMMMPVPRNMQVRNNVPYQIVGGTPFWTRREVKDLMAYIKLALNPEDNLSLMRAINQPTRGIGAESQVKLKGWAEGQGLSLAQALFPDYQVSQIGFLAWGLWGKTWDFT